MKKIKTGMDYHTSRLERRSCGCEIVIDITVTKLGGVSLFPSINYCKLHGLGPELKDVLFEKERGDDQC